MHANFGTAMGACLGHGIFRIGGTGTPRRPHSDREKSLEIESELKKVAAAAATGGDAISRLVYHIESVTGCGATWPGG